MIGSRAKWQEGISLSLVKYMTLLNVETSYRAYLEAKHAITVDADGCETLVGLTSSESKEYLTIAGQPFSKQQKGDVIDPQRFLVLYDKHMNAVPPTPFIVGSLFAKMRVKTG